MKSVSSVCQFLKAVFYSWLLFQESSRRLPPNTHTKMFLHAPFHRCGEKIKNSREESLRRQILGMCLCSQEKTVISIKNPQLHLGRWKPSFGVVEPLNVASKELRGSSCFEQLHPSKVNLEDVNDSAWMIRIFCTSSCQKSCHRSCQRNTLSVQAAQSRLIKVNSLCGTYLWCQWKSVHCIQIHIQIRFLTCGNHFKNCRTAHSCFCT